MCIFRQFCSTFVYLFLKLCLIWALNRYFWWMWSYFVPIICNFCSFWIKFLKNEWQKSFLISNQAQVGKAWLSHLCSSCTPSQILQCCTHAGLIIPLIQFKNCLWWKIICRGKFYWIENNLSTFSCDFRTGKQIETWLSWIVWQPKLFILPWTQIWGTEENGS